MNIFLGSLGPYSDAEIRIKISGCPKLASLRAINTALSQLINAEGGVTSEIAEVIRRDPTLTTRLLKLVNSVFFGLSRKVTNLEEAIIHLGLRQIRELALATPIIEEFDDLHPQFDNVHWEFFWQHSIGTAIVGRDLLEIANLSFLDEMDYVIGLVHNVGKLILATTFPEEFQQIFQESPQTTSAVCKLEEQYIGWDHGKIGGFYLQNHGMAQEIVEAVTFHNSPEAAPNYSHLAAIMSIADHMVRSMGVPGLENLEEIATEDSWRELPLWDTLFPEDEQEVLFGIADLKHTLKRLPHILNGIVKNPSQKRPGVAS